MSASIFPELGEKYSRIPSFPCCSLMALIYIIIINKGVTPTGSNQRNYIAGGLGEEERGKHRKVGVKRKCRVLAQPPYSPQGNGRQSPMAEP